MVFMLAKELLLSKRKSIKAIEDFVAGGGDLYVPIPIKKLVSKQLARV